MFRSTRLRFAWLLVFLGVAGTVGSGCGSSKPRWVADEAILRELVQLNPELDANQRSRVLLHRFVKSAVTLDGTDPEASYKQARVRTRVAFESLQAYFGVNAPAADGFNICYPASYQAPKDSDPTRNFQFMQQCRLIQNNGPSVRELRGDPLVSKYLDSKGNLVAPTDLETFHQDLNDAWSRRDPNNEQLDLYLGLPRIQLGWPTGTIS
jgi:hypothetical protein